MVGLRGSRVGDQDGLGKVRVEGVVFVRAAAVVQAERLRGGVGVEQRRSGMAVGEEEGFGDFGGEGALGFGGCCCVGGVWVRVGVWDLCFWRRVGDVAFGQDRDRFRVEEGEVEGRLFAVGGRGDVVFCRTNGQLVCF